MLFDCMGSCVMSMAHESEPGGCPGHVYMVENISVFFFSPNLAMSLDGLCFESFFFFF